MPDKFNSPWNIADPFDMPMEFSVSEIADMLSEYEQDHHTDHGWMVSFCFNQNKKVGVHKVQFGDMTISEAIV